MSHAVCTSKRASGLLGAVGSLAAIAAFAMGFSTPAAAGLYGGVGASRVSTDLFAEDPAIVQKDPRLALRFFGGYSFSDYLSVEGGYSDVDSVFAVLGPEAFHADITGIDISVLGKLPLFKFLNQPYSLYVKVGAISWQSEITISGNGPTEKFDEDGTDLVYGGGMQVIFFKHILFRGGIEVLDIDPADAGAGNITLGGVQMGLNF